MTDHPAGPATVYFAPMRSAMKRSMVTRVGKLLARAGLAEAVAEGDLVAVTGGVAVHVAGSTNLIQVHRV